MIRPESAASMVAQPGPAIAPGGHIPLITQTSPRQPTTADVMATSADLDDDGIWA